MQLYFFNVEKNNNKELVKTNHHDSSSSSTSMFQKHVQKDRIYAYDHYSLTQFVHFFVSHFDCFPLSFKYVITLFKEKQNINNYIGKHLI